MIGKTQLSQGLRFLILATLASILSFSVMAAPSDEKPEEYIKNPDQYYQNPNNVGKCASCDSAYFNNPLNIGKNNDAQKKFFSTPGAVLKAPQGAQAWLTKLRVEATVDFSRAERGVVLDITTGSLTNGKMSLTPKEYPKGTLIQALPEGGFMISKTTVKGFSKISYDQSTGVYTMDGAKVRLPPTPANGQKIEATKDASGNLKEVSLPANARYDLPDGRRRILAREAATLLFDGSDPLSRIDAAIGITKGSMKVSNKVNAFLWNGNLQVFASKGRYAQKEFPGFIGGTIELQNKDGKTITLRSAGDSTGLESVRSKPIRYDQGFELDSRRSLVKRAQQLLNLDGASLKEDGKFGPKTEAAIAAFQAKHGIITAEPGALDEQTLRALDQESGLILSSKRESGESAIRRLAQAGYSDPTKWGSFKRPALIEDQTSNRLDTPPTVDRNLLVNYYTNLAGKAYGKNEQLLRDIPAAIYQAAAEAEKKYGFPIDPAKLLALAAHETSAENDNGAFLPFNSYNARVRNNFGGIGGAGHYREYDTPLEGARALVNHMYTSSHYFKRGKYSITAISRTWCPLSDDGCDGHLNTWKNIYNRYKNLG